ncbi:ropporin-1-like isoform X2 [Engraulis encrasicolus]|uniref:ropporin-1-like isoform X2 n=1 Tax=Engraulis encrasicolus TaxID=184585 RepID=UPI002FD38517
MYFAALVKEDPLPIDQPSDHAVHNVRKLTTDILAQLHGQLGKKKMVSQRVIVLTWKSYNLAENCLTEAFTLGRFGEQLDWMQFLLLCCNFLGKNTRMALYHACHILNTDPGKPFDPCVTFSLFRFMFTFLAHATNTLTKTQVTETLFHLQQKTKDGMIKVSDFYADSRIILDPPQRTPL